MNHYFSFSALPVKMVLLILALTALIALHSNPTAVPVAPQQTADTVHADALPLGLVPWAMSLLESETFARLKHIPVLQYQRPDQIITHLVDGSKKKTDSVGIDLEKFDSQH